MGTLPTIVTMIPTTIVDLGPGLLLSMQPVVDLRLLLTPLSEIKKTTTMVVNGRLVQPRRSRVAAAPLQAFASSFAFAICMTGQLASGGKYTKGELFLDMGSCVD